MVIEARWKKSGVKGWTEWTALDLEEGCNADDIEWDLVRALLRGTSYRYPEEIPTRLTLHRAGGIKSQYRRR